MLDRLLAWTGLMAEPGRWQLCQITALLAFALLFSIGRRPGERALPVALGVICAALFACLLDPLLRLPAAIVGRFSEPLFRGVIVSYGALGGLVAGVAIAEKLASRSVANALDQLAMPLGAVVVLSRLGCLLAGCDFGSPTSWRWAITYGANTPALAAQRDAGLVPIDATEALPVHPTQAYEMIAGLVMIAVALAIPERTRRRGPGIVFAATAATYAMLRLFIEPLRGDPSPRILGLRLAMWLSVLALGLTGLLLPRPKPDESPTARDR
ncbi:MAG: prolipoprotein diacylglyceryl transferase family protein [Polyangiaceae bacterium]